MIYLDASALLALLFDEPAAPDVADILREGDVCITSVNYAEVIDQATRVQRKGTDALARAMDPLVAGNLLRIANVSPDIGQRAGEIRAQYYDRRTRPISLGDCVLLGAATLDQGDVATSDQTLADVARAVRLVVRPLPNSHGLRLTNR